MTGGDPGTALSVALVQVAASRVPADNRERLAGLVVPPADLVVLPEAFQRDLGAAGDAVAPDAEPLDGPFVGALLARAGEHGGTWVAGMMERSEDPERPFNTLVVVDPSGLRAAYRKIHLYDSFGFKESDRLLAGPRTPVTLGLGGFTLGLMTCYDLRFPELARALTRAGADLLVVPAAWVAGRRKVRHWQTLVTARAIENVAYVAAVCQPGPRYTGHSMLVDPRGDVLVSAGEGPDVLVVEVSAAALAEARAENPSLLNRRDDQPWLPGPSPAATGRPEG